MWKIARIRKFTNNYAVKMTEASEVKPYIKIKDRKRTNKTTILHSVFISNSGELK